MTLKKELIDICYRFIITSAIALLVFLEIYNIFDPELITTKNIIVILLISLSFNVLLLIYHRIHLYLIPAIVLAGIVFALLIDREDAILILNSDMFKLVIISFGAFVFFLVFDCMTALSLLASAGFFIYMIVVLIGDFMIHPASPALIVFYIVLSLTRIFRNDKAKPGNAQKDEGEEEDEEKKPARTRRYITFLMPFLLVFPIAIAALPKSDEPISWNWAVRLYNIVSEKINEITHELSLKFGSGEDGWTEINFGYDESMDYDNASGDEKTLMQIRSDSIIYGSCYLKGEIFNLFSEGAWHNTLNTEKDYSTIDAFETYYGVLNFDREVRNDILKQGTLKVKYLDFVTRVMFLPAKMIPKNNSPEYGEVTASNEHLLYKERKTYGTEYSVDFYQLNYDSLPFRDFMETDLNDNVDIFTTTKKEYLVAGYGSIRFEDLLDYRNYINEYFVSRPRVRDSVKKWIEAVTEGEETDYGKLKAVEEALSSYEYSLESGELPDYVKSEGDFLNYFLIEKKSGYCVHYATAFCLLARAMGYPSRVIQGYKVPVEANQDIIVYNKFGHTWPEVYFEGKGWIAFEPTPGMAGERYGRWKIYSGKYSEYENQWDYSYQPKYPIDAVDEEYSDSHSENKTESRVSGMLILIIAGIIVFSLIFLVVFTVVLNRVKRKRMSPDRRYTMEFKDILNILKELKVYRTDEETIEEFSSRCGTEVTRGILKDKDIFSFFGTYESFIYGNLEIGNPEIEEIASAKEQLLLRLKEVCGITYPLHKLRLYFMS